MSNASDPTANDRAESPQTGDPGRNPHLTDDQLTMVVDRDAASGEWTAAQGHLADCARCRADVAQLRATRDLLRALPPPRSRRSFRLTEAEARAATPRWRSWGRILLPGMAGLRVATATVALLLLAVTATDVLTNRDQDSGETARSSQPVSSPNAGQAFAQSTAPPPTAAMVQAAVVRTVPPVPTQAVAARAPAAPQAAKANSAGDSSGTTGAPAETAAEGMPHSATSSPIPAGDASGSGSSFSAAAAAAPETQGTATVPASTPEPATPVPIPATPPPGTPAASAAAKLAVQTGDAGVSRWRVAELGLLLLLGWLLVSQAGVRWTRRGEGRQDGGGNAGN